MSNRGSLMASIQPCEAVRTAERTMSGGQSRPTQYAAYVWRTCDDTVPTAQNFFARGFPHDRATSVLRTAAREVRCDPVADLAHGAVAAAAAQQDVRGPPRVGMRVGDGHRASHGPHAAQIVDVVADVDDVGRVDASFV